MECSASYTDSKPLGERYGNRWVGPTFFGHAAHSLILYCYILQSTWV